MALLLAVLLSQLGSVVMVVTAQCAAPLTVMLAGRQ